MAYEWAKATDNKNYMGQTSLYLKELESNTVKPINDLVVDNYIEDVKSLDHILAALYDVISGEKGVKRDWARFKNLFIEDAQLIPTGKSKAGKTGYRVMTPADYVQNAGKFLEENGFHEVEISRKIEEYGSLVHAFSTYESYHSKSDEKPFARGINSIQLMNDGERWWVVSIYWLGESEAMPLPPNYLPKK